MFGWNSSDHSGRLLSSHRGPGRPPSQAERSLLPLRRRGMGCRCRRPAPSCREEGAQRELPSSQGSTLHLGREPAS